MKKHAKHREGRAPSQRQLRVGEELRHILAQILGRHEMRDPALQDVVVTVTEVRISPDLKNATAFVMPLGGEHKPEIKAALDRAAPFMRGLIARELDLRHVPALKFMLDTSFEHASRIDELLHSPAVERDLSAGEADESGQADNREDDGA